MYLTSVYVCHVPDYVVVVVVSAIGGNPVSISIQYMSDNYCVYSQTHLNQISTRHSKAKKKKVKKRGK